LKVFEYKKNDYFPYTDKPNQYWSGYYSSRTTFKYWISYSNWYLQI